jgi:CDP-diacylglycerol--glycerol-3-phosphate 3-phosphatidyltransferase
MTQTPDTLSMETKVVAGPRRFKDRLKHIAHDALNPVVAMLARAGVRPDVLTAVGCGLSIGGGLAFFEGGFRGGAALLVLAGVCDILDGELARASGKVTTFGAFLDSTLDRAAEAFVLVGITGFYVVNMLELAQNPARVLEELARGLEPRTWAVVALTGMLALVGSFLVSYTRARAEGLGLECKVGWFERPERMVVLIIAGLFGVGPVMPGALLVLATLSFVTAGQRVMHVYRITRARETDAEH